MITNLKYDIIAVLVTHNRLEQLKQIVEALKNQTYTIKRIIIINNDSKDGTKEWLEHQKELHTIHQPNTGGSGGFCTGVKKALESGADWIWLLDDDVLPADDCLEQLLSYSKISHCIQPIRLTERKEMLDEERFLDINSCRIITSNNISFKSGKSYTTTNIGCFEGMLVAKEIVEKIGFPDVRFFLAHDDMTYGYLASKYTNIVVTNKAVLQKLPSSFVRYDSLLYLYFSMRNLWLVNDYLSKDFPQTKNYRSRKIFFQFLSRAKEIITTNHYQNKWKALTVLGKAYKDYKRKKTGNTFHG